MRQCNRVVDGRGAVHFLGALMAMGAGVAVVHGDRAQAAPPVRYTGELRSNTRAVIRDQGENAVQLANTARLNLDSFIWQPWFATYAAGFDVSFANNFADNDSHGLLLGGDGEVTLLPKSRFPFTAYASVANDQANLESEFVEDRNVTRLRFGAVQRYRPLSGKGQYAARIERSVLDDADGFRDTIDRATLQGSHRFTRHYIEGDVIVRNETFERFDSELFELQATARHTYRPSSEFSLESNAFFTDQDARLSDTDSHISQSIVTSVALWRPDDRPLTGTVTTRWGRTSVKAAGVDGTTNVVNMSGVLNYDVNPSLRATGTLTGEFSSGPDRSGTLSTQSLGLSYTPPSRPLGRYTYNWYASGDVNNRMGGQDGDQQNVGGTIGHGLNRVSSLSAAPPTTLSTGFGQSLTLRHDSRVGPLGTLNNRASVGLARATTRSSDQLRFNFNDTRSEGTGGPRLAKSTEFQSVDLTGSHDGTLSRFASWGASYSGGFNRQVIDGDSSTNQFARFNLSYRHNRLFDVPRLRFESQLSYDSDSLYFGGGDFDRNDLTWRNELNYSIGLLDVRLRGTFTRIRGRNQTFILLTITRRFAGIL